MGIAVIDRGFTKLVNALKGKKANRITVGIHTADGTKPHPNGDGLTIADIANIHEFGAPGIPQRSFLRAWFDENRAKNREAVKRMAKAVLTGKYTREQAIELLAQAFVGQIQKRMAQGIPPPLAQSTIDNKGSSKPLIDSGQLRSAISYAIDGELKKTQGT